MLVALHPTSSQGADQYRRRNIYQKVDFSRILLGDIQTLAVASARAISSAL
jgi:hypothetical protein